MGNRRDAEAREINRADVEGRNARLLEEYGDVPVREETGIGCAVVEPFLISRRITVAERASDERRHTLWVFLDGHFVRAHGWELSITDREAGGVRFEVEWFQTSVDGVSGTS